MNDTKSRTNSTLKNDSKSRTNSTLKNDTKSRTNSTLKVDYKNIVGHIRSQVRIFIEFNKIKNNNIEDIFISLNNRIDAVLAMQLLLCQCLKQDLY